MALKAPRISSFGFEPGDRIGGKYRVEAFLGSGVQGEVYRVTEMQTGIRRAAKLFYPHENKRNAAARVYAQKLDRLRDCPIVIKYHHAEYLPIQGTKVACLVSELVDGILLSSFVNSQPGQRLQPFKALHLLYPLVCGLEQIHARREYHGDLHPWNILVQPRGIFFDLKLVDFYNHGPSTALHRKVDVIDAIHLLYHMVGGRRHYARQPAAIKSICRGLRRDLIMEAFPSARHLRRRLETFPDLFVV